MVAERITPEAIAAELDVIDGEAKRIAGDTVVSIGFTNVAVKDLTPHEWESVASYLLALLAREPVRSSPGYACHRIVLGSLASELRGFAAAAGEPVGLQADLRAASTQADERRIRARLADHAAAYDREIDEALLAQAARRLYESPDDHIPDDDQEVQPSEPTNGHMTNGAPLDLSWL